MKLWMPSTRSTFKRETLSASASTQRMRFAATKSGKWLVARGAYVVFGGIHATLYPAKRTNWVAPMRSSKATEMWCGPGFCRIAATELRSRSTKVGRIEATEFLPARWDLVPRKSYMWASVQTVRGCPKHCSFCSVWRTDGQRPRQRASDVVVEEIVQLRRLGLSLHRPRRRQFLSRDAYRFAAGRTAAQHATG